VPRDSGADPARPAVNSARRSSPEGSRPQKGAPKKTPIRILPPPPRVMDCRIVT
jgi:hypothetical protein